MVEPLLTSDVPAGTSDEGQMTPIETDIVEEEKKPETGREGAGGGFQGTGPSRTILSFTLRISIDLLDRMMNLASEPVLLKNRSIWGKVSYC